MCYYPTKLKKRIKLHFKNIYNLIYLIIKYILWLYGDRALLASGVVSRGDVWGRPRVDAVTRFLALGALIGAASGSESDGDE